MVATSNSPESEPVRSAGCSRACAPSHLDTDRLLDACRQGDAKAWDALVERYQRLVYAVALREGLSEDDAADATQSTFEALLRSLDRITDSTAIGSWLTCVARRAAWRQRNGQRKENSILHSDVAPIMAEANDDEIGDNDRLLWVYESLLELGEPCRQLITALYFDPAEPSYEEIAERAGRPVGSIGPTRARCLERLRSVLKQREAA